MKHRGSIYFLTLASSIVLVLAVMGLSFTIIQYRRTSRSNEQIDQAHIYTQLGIRHALYFTHQTPNWRNLLTSGPWMQDILNGNAAYTVTGIDQTDGLLSNGVDPVRLACTATVNGVHRTLTVQTKQPPLALLCYALAAQDLITISNKAGINGNVACNAGIAKSGKNSYINGNVEVVDGIDQTTNISGSITTGIEPKTFPDEQAILDYYLPHATEITYIPVFADLTLSSTQNIKGPSTNSNGLYLINCANQDITILNCTIRGTLILLDVGNSGGVNGVNIEGTTNWQPARPDYPALIITGGKVVTINITPPNSIKGTLYINGDLETYAASLLTGPVIINGKADIMGDTIISFNPFYGSINPTKIFLESYLQPVRGTWQEVIF